jgi:hypothetical protein
MPFTLVTVFYISGGMSLYTTGVTILDRKVELINPPIMTMASGDISGLLDQAIGNSPPMVAS